MYLHIPLYIGIIYIASTVPCREDQFQCPNNGPFGQSCYPLYYRCDGFEDCEDGFDEENCTTGVRLSKDCIVMKDCSWIKCSTACKQGGCVLTIAFHHVIGEQSYVHR